jgi:hypothetical protein
MKSPARPHRRCPIPIPIPVSAFVLVAAFAFPVSAQDSLDKPAHDSLAQLARGFILAAVDDAAHAAVLAGEKLPPDLRRDFDAIHAAPRAKDIREASTAKLKIALLKSLVDETPEAQDVERRFADYAGKLAAELDDLVARASKSRTAAQDLLKESTDGKHVSPAAVNAGKAGPMGPLLLRLARAAPFLRADVKGEVFYERRYRVLERAYERAPDAQAATILSILDTVEGKSDPQLTTADTQLLLGLVKARLDAAKTATLDALSASKDAATRLRQGELTRAISGVRNADLEYAVKLLSAYRKQFSTAPALDATEIQGVYFDRNTNRVYFYIEGEDRWIEGAPHAASLTPVTVFLLEAQDPRLSRRATDPRALAALYHAFGEKVPFESGLAEAVRVARSLCGRARALSATAASGGATPDEIDRFLAEQAGYDRELAGPLPGLDDDLCSRHAMERLAWAVVEGGPKAATALVDELQAALASLEKVKLLAFSGIRVEAPPGVSEVALELRSSLATAPLVAPPRTLVAGGSARCVFVVQAGEDPTGATIVAEAEGARSEPFTGRLELDTTAALASGHVEGRSLVLAPGAALTIHGRRGNKVQVGERLLVRVHPARAVRLKLVGPGKEEEWAPWTREGGLIEPSAVWPMGTWTAVALDAHNLAIAHATFEVEKAIGVVCADAAGTRLVHARAGSRVDVCFLENGTPLPAGEATIGLEHETGGLAWAPKEHVTCPKVTVEIPADLAPGRYRLVAQIGTVRIPGWPLAVTKEDPRVTFVRDPFSVEAPASVGAGERLYARIEPGFAVDPSEVANAIVELEALGRGTAARARCVPAPGFPVSGLVLPFTLKDSIPPGNWDLVADVYVALGRVRARGKVRIDPGADLPFTLRPADGGEPRELYARGDRLRVQVGDVAPVGTASFVLVGPGELGSPIEPDDTGAVSLAIPADAATGAWELRGVARQEGSLLARTVRFEVYTPARFSVNVKGRVGEQGLVDVPVPPGYEEPVRIRVGSVWTDSNKAVVIPIEGATSVPLILEDKRGKRAEGEALVEIVSDARTSDAGTRTSGGPRFAIVANLKEKTFFYPGYESISRMLRESRLPKEWVVVEAGPLTAADTREHVFARIPYDGPRGVNPISIYRSQRYWKNLPAPVQAAFAAAGFDDGTVFDVTNAPVTDDDRTTLEDLARRFVESKGGWVYELEKVKVRAAAALADQGSENEISFRGASASAETGGVTRVLAPGAMGDLELRADLPEKLVLGQPWALAASVAAIPTTLDAGHVYPGGLEKLAPRALLSVSLEGALDVEGKSIAVLASSSSGHAPGRELVFVATPTKTERSDDGSARVAEDMGLSSAPPGGRLEARLEPVPPGTLANRPVRVTVRFKARLTAAIEAAAFAEPHGATVTIDGKSYVQDALDSTIPRTELELEASYVRQSSEGAPPLPKPPAVLGPSRFEGGKPEALEPLDAEVELQAASAAALASRFGEAEAHARNALHADAGRADAWALAGEMLLRRARPGDGLPALTRAAALQPVGRTLVLLAEALEATGRAAEARAAAKRALAAGLDSELSARARKISGE